PGEHPAESTQDAVLQCERPQRTAPEGVPMAEPWREHARQVGWVLLPLRAFLAIVFLDGGISKIADPRFLDDASPLSMHASVTAIRSSSPIGGALGVVENHSAAFGVAM